MLTQNHEIVISIHEGKWYLRRNIDRSVQLYNQFGELVPLRSLFGELGAVTLFAIEDAIEAGEMITIIKRNTPPSFGTPELHMARQVR